MDKIVRSFDGFLKALGTDSPFKPSERPSAFKYRVLAEGDSWFHLNEIRPLENIILSCSPPKSTFIVNMALSGDTVQQQSGINPNGLFNKKRIKIRDRAVKNYKWDYFLLSAGGNDLKNAFVGEYKIKGQKIQLLKECKKPTDYKDFINEELLNQVMDEIKFGYGLLINQLRLGQNKDARIVGHTYDYFTMRNCTKNKDKSERQKLLEKLGVPSTYWKSISAYMNDRLAEALLSFNNNPFFPNVTIINTLSCLHQADQEICGNTEHWRNEIHPNKDGYKILCKDRINKELHP